ncbi:prolactin regulatory element-binding protein [Planococcus citri]|uniref:prolactin regulatory element-binding protein n=1 Tax=Planococcus citri TaxID=170843 RepID=UPI0031F8C897
MTRQTKNTYILAEVDFPLYSIQLLTCRHVFVAGGGGGSKTGISNGFECFELLHNNDSISAQKVLRHDTGDIAVMNCAVITKNKNSYIAAGENNRCQLYKVKCCICSEEKNRTNHHEKDDNTSSAPRNRKNTPAVNNHSTNGLVYNKSMTFQFLPYKSIETEFQWIKTEFHNEPPVQKAVRVSLKHDIIVTGGTDGHIRVWKFPSFELKIDIDAHTNEIDDLDIDSNSSKIVSVSKDKTAVIWDSSTGSKIHELKWTPPDGMKYLFKRSRFSILENDPKVSCLFMLTNAIGGRKMGKNPAQIQLWNPGRGLLVKYAEFKEDLSALTVRNDGRFVAVGTRLGSVYILTAFNLKIAMTIPNAHSIFITGLEFVPVPRSDDDDSFTTTAEASVISISVDRKICMHNLKQRDTIPLWIAVLLLCLVLLATFTCCSYVGL